MVAVTQHYSSWAEWRYQMSLYYWDWKTTPLMYGYQRLGRESADDVLMPDVLPLTLKLAREPLTEEGRRNLLEMFGEH